MRAPLSIVMPTLEAAQALPDTLACLVEGLSAGLVRELVISDGGSSDATLAIAEAAGAVVVEGPRGRGGQLRRGAEAASGAWLLFLHADTHLPADWPDLVAGHIAGSGDAACFRLGFRAAGAMPRVVAGWANLRSRAGLPYGDQGLLISRALYDSVGGYTDIPLMEDVAIARALRGRITLLDGRAMTGADRYLRDGWIRRGARNLSVLVAFLAGMPPEKLVRRYERQGRE